MHLNELTRYGIPSRILDAWQERQGGVLLPIQSRAVQHGLLGNVVEGGRPANLLLSAPTSSGKSFCAELAAIRALMNRQKAILLFPLKSLAEEKYRLLQNTYSNLGIKSLIATSDHPENDAAFRAGRFDIAVAIPEKFDLLLTEHLDTLANIGLVTVDEIQMIGEPGRGAVLERLLTKVIASRYDPVLLALSAVLGDCAVEPLADWLGASLVEETMRPRDLLCGVVAERRFRFRSFNHGGDGEESFCEFDLADEKTASILAGQISGDGGSTLLFLKSRSDAVNLALRLASSGHWPPAEKALQELADEEPSFLLQSLSQSLRHGVAFHSSDLSGRQRVIIGQAFITQEIRALCSTTTLALGVNLPADTVYLETVKYSSG
ncbi:MAG: hypothetical protein DRP45_04435, partial [Candidatus Zixiibacteriota bacterium]